jgi:anti-anti-sigma factor
MSSHRTASVPVGTNTEALLSLHLTCRGPVAVIAISGELDISTVHLLTELVEQVARDHPAEVVLDMARVSFFGAQGISALIRARDVIIASGGQLRLRAPCALTLKLLTLTGVDHLFAIDPAGIKHAWSSRSALAAGLPVLVKAALETAAHWAARRPGRPRRGQRP